MRTPFSLVSRAKKGDPDAFQALIHAEKEKLYKMAYVYVRSEEEALDVFQETLYKALASLPTLKNNAYFSTWLTRILINTAIAHLKKKRRVVPMDQDVLNHVKHTGDSSCDVRLDLLQAIEELEEKYKTVLLLRFYRDYTVKQIATLLNCPEGTVKTRIHRGLAFLRKKLKGAYTDDRRDSTL